MLPHFNSVHTIVFDFDGIFTDNKVIVNQDGTESVTCDRSDGLGLSMLRKFISRSQWNPDYFILSTETNCVVRTRAQKLKIPVYQSIENKYDFLCKYMEDKSRSFSGVIYLGNDINDLEVMSHPDVYSVAPFDSHPLICNFADLVLPKKGGEGFVRHFVESLILQDGYSASDILSLT